MDFEKNNLEEFWSELKEMREILNSLGDIKVIKNFIHENMKDEIEDLTNKFKHDFEELSSQDPLKLEVLQTLGELGILVY